MALEPGSGAMSGSPESSGRDSPIPRQWRNQLGGGDVSPVKDKGLRRYAQGVDKVLALFETTLEEWADYISFLNKVLRALQARPGNCTIIPSKATVAKRLSQCLDPNLPSGVHQKALEVYNYIFEVIGKDGLSRDLPLYLPGLAPTLSFASLSVRSPFLELLETHFTHINARSLRPAMRSIILALLPGLEDESSEDFDRTLHLVAKFKVAIRPAESKELTDHHSTGDDFFWQCFFLATITSHSRRAGALAYLVRFLPVLGSTPKGDGSKSAAQEVDPALMNIVTSPEPGLLVRCFASGLADEQLLIQRGFLDLLVSHLPLNSGVLQKQVKSGDIELLLKAATGVVIRRDMSLNRRLWAWLLGPEPTGPDGDPITDMAALPSDQQQIYLAARTNFFEEYGMSALVKALLDMIKETEASDSVERARPYRICLSLMDRWEIGGLVVPEIFLPVIKSVKGFKSSAATAAEFKEVLRSASVFFDGIESGLIYSELVSLLAQAIGPGPATTEDRLEKLSLIDFVISNFNVREEEMVTIHAPLTCLAALYMLEDSKGRKSSPTPNDTDLINKVLSIVTSLLDLIPERAFPAISKGSEEQHKDSDFSKSLSNVELLKRIRNFYVNEQGNLDTASAPFTKAQTGELLLARAAKSMVELSDGLNSTIDVTYRVKILLLVVMKVDSTYNLDTAALLGHMQTVLKSSGSLQFSDYSSLLLLAVQLHYAERITLDELAELTAPLVNHAWSYLSVSEPKYHVETVKSLWQLQTALTAERRDIEAALSTIIVKQTAAGTSDIGRVFSILWSHTLQDNQPERRGSKGQLSDLRTSPRLSGADSYPIMLSQPLFLILDTLFDERTTQYMTVKAWLTTMIGIDRLYLLIATKLDQLSFFSIPLEFEKEKELVAVPKQFTEDDDVDLGLYYLRALNQVLQCTRDTSWGVLAAKYLAYNGRRLHISSGGEDNSIPLQEYFARICMACITCTASPDADEQLQHSVSQLQRYALTVLHQFLRSRWAPSLAKLRLENVLVDALWKSLSRQDSYMQILLLDAVHDSLHLQELAVPEPPTSPTADRSRQSLERLRARQPSAAAPDARFSLQLPSQLLKCLQAGLSAPSSQAVLDSWVVFLGECLPMYSSSIFQILIPLVESLCKQITDTFSNLATTFQTSNAPLGSGAEAPESTLIYLLNGLEQVLARAHDQLVADEERAELAKGPDQPQSLFGSMVSGVFQSDTPQSRSATANDRLTVHLAFQDAVRICYKIWSWGQGDEAARQDTASAASFSYTSLRMRNRARRLLEHLFATETLECLEIVIDIWHNSETEAEWSLCFDFLAALDAARPRQTVPSLFNSMYSRTNPTALDPSRQSAMTVSLADTELAVFLVQYARRLDDDAMDEIWADCITFLKDILANPLPHRQILPSLLEFAVILGEKVDNTNFGDQRKMRRELGDLFLRLVAAMFTTRPMTFTDQSMSEKSTIIKGPTAGIDDTIGILASVVPNLHKVVPEHDRTLSAASTISTNVIGPMLKSKIFPDSISRSAMRLMHELSKLQNNQKSWKKDVGDAFNDNRFFGMNLTLVSNDWLPLLKQWFFADKEKMPEIVSRIAAPTTAGIVFGVGATSARLEADRKTQLNLRRIATLILAGTEDAFVMDLPVIFGKLVELLSATNTSSPSSTTRADIYMAVRALVLRMNPVHLSMLWPVINAEMHAAISSVIAPDNSAAADTYAIASIFQACKLLDLLICLAPDDFQLHEWLFITDNIDAIYRSSSTQPVALADEISEDLGSAAYAATAGGHEDIGNVSALSGGPRRRLLLGPGGIGDNVTFERKDELVAKVLRPFFGQLSIFAFESVYAMGAPDTEAYVQSLLRDLFDEKTMVKAL